MLKRIEIQNYAIIDELQVDFDAGLNIITGETGAGKSILLGALQLIMGHRADTKVLYDQGKKCFVEATFDIADHDLQAFFEEVDLDYFDELTIRREINTTGKSRAFVNDTPTTLATLRQLTEQLVDLHRQFDTLDIHQVSFQTRTLDALAGNQARMETYASQYQALLATRRKLATLQATQSQALQEVDFLTFQVNELDQADLQPGELTEKEALLDRLSATEDLKRIGHLVQHSLDGSEQSILPQLEALLSEADSIKAVDQSLGDLYDRLFSSIEELRDLAAGYGDVAESAEYDPTLAAVTQERLDTIYKLQNKHRLTSVDELMALHEQLATQLQGYTSMDADIAALEAEIAEQENQLLAQAQTLSKHRQGVTQQLQTDVENLLAELSMPHARLKIEVAPRAELGPTGVDDIAFLFASNKGSTFLPIKDVASGGEISRLTLCIKSLIADAITLPTLIFDEIDTGVSGEVAKKMGEIFADLSQRHQVISITHSPQIASRADKHFFVYKQDTTDRTLTAIRVLDLEDRVEELGKMLSGNPPSEAALANARQMIAAK